MQRLRGGEDIPVSILIVLGPSHPQWPGPQQLMLRITGEVVGEVDYRFEEADDLAQKLGRGDAEQALHALRGHLPRAGVAHALALCLAVEQIAGVVAPPRAAFLRCVAAELERLIDHVDVVALLMEIMGLERRRRELSGLSDAARAALAELAGPEPAALPAPGGLRSNLTEGRRERVQAQLADVEQGLYRFIDRIIENQLLLQRSVGIGLLSRAAAEQFGVRGPVARASGIPRDVRLDQPYAGYADLQPRLITQDGGDVYARLILLLLEAFESAKVAGRGLAELPDGEWVFQLPPELPRGQGVVQVEAPAGALRYQVEGHGARLQHVQIDAPRQLDRLLARTLLDRALVDNSLLIVASVAPFVGELG